MADGRRMFRYGSTSWRLSAACLGRDLEMFFAAGGPDLRRAKAVCAVCPVRDRCLEDALARGDEYEVRGGLTPGERRKHEAGAPVPQRKPPRSAPAPVPATRAGHAERARTGALATLLLGRVVGVLAEAAGLPAGPLCIRCRRSLRRCRNCPYCGQRDARTAGWPASRLAGAA